uniref:Uncharacterized protein n=1 Tax=Peronospora matthiolae TaxID=2874970 RepID=A0AAV1TSG0_9STRA
MTLVRLSLLEVYATDDEAKERVDDGTSLGPLQDRSPCWRVCPSSMTSRDGAISLTRRFTRTDVRKGDAQQQQSCRRRSRVKKRIDRKTRLLLHVLNHVRVRL